VTMASSAGRVATPVPTAYAVVKAAVVMLSQRVTGEVGKHCVRANCLAWPQILS
jgi:NAD(P)-dependent dehydrogenase (short-subunit alcohol dehydrogenase family)